MPTLAPRTPPPEHRRTASNSNKVVKKTSPSSKASASKSWSTEDERILLQSRMQRIPYKQIGAKLGKTDLACRLHFHQMLMAKRGPETQPGRSIVFLSSEHMPEVHRLLPRTASNAQSGMPYCPTVSDVIPPPTTALSLAVQQPSPLHQRTKSFPETSRSLNTSWQPFESPYLDQRQKPVDFNRLDMIYKECANDFWSNIAAKYAGAQISAAELEQAFLNKRPSGDKLTASTTPLANNHEFLPPPPRNYQFQPPLMHSRSHSTVPLGKCSVESLLNHNF